MYTLQPTGIKRMPWDCVTTANVRNPDYSKSDSDILAAASIDIFQDSSEICL